MRFLPFLLVRGLACAGLALALLSTPARAQEVKILFVGNSFTHGKFKPILHYNAGGVTDENGSVAPGSVTTTAPARAEFTFGEPGPYGGIPGIFKKFTVAAGLTYTVSLETISGQSLTVHYANALPVIAQAKWNVVVLQELSSRPVAPEHGGDRAAFNTAVQNITQAVRATNPAPDPGDPSNPPDLRAKIYLYQTWARADQTYPPTSLYYPNPIETMGNELIAGYDMALAAANAGSDPGAVAGIIPAGKAWLNAIQQGAAVRNPYTDTGLTLWGVDYYHPSRYGAYLNALVIFGRVTGVRPNRPDLSVSFDAVAAEIGISATDAASLRQVADATVNPPLPRPARSAAGDSR